MTSRQRAVARALAARAITPSAEERKGAPLEEIFGRNVFGPDEMRRRLPADVFGELSRTVREGERLNPAIADAVANAMKDWAVERGATHYAHWFQPMTGLTAEKHDAFLSVTVGGSAISEFSGMMLISGEPDASSFPSGGLRSTFEARGCTAWDPASPVFIVEEPCGATLHIPAFFSSHSGEALDRRIPLRRSMQALSRQALRILRLLGNSRAKFVQPMVGPEQEFFLVDAGLAALRPDVLMTGRTLLGAPSPRGQEMEDHYLGAVPVRVLSFMQDLERRLLALGIPVKTRHNEAAPGQFAISPVQENAAVACDHNMLVMNVMRLLAGRHGFVCLFHEKPFAGVNGSGKRVSWSLADSEGRNLLDPGRTPQDNAQFLVFLAAVLAAVHRHPTALRLGAVGAGNDRRLGTDGAPPAILSVCLGEQLTEVVNGIAGGAHAPVSTLPPLPADTADRNRTSPFAFTGNKFEFRALGASQSIAPFSIALNAAVTCALDDIATELEVTLAAGTPLNDALQEMLPRLFRGHMPVVFNGNGYSSSWPEEAARRGLPCHSDTVEALERYADPEVMNVFLRHGIFNEREMLSRQEILFGSYANTIAMEGRVLADMVRGRVLPPAMAMQKDAAEAFVAARDALAGPAEREQRRFRRLRDMAVALEDGVERLEKVVALTGATSGAMEKARVARDGILPAMTECRAQADKLEAMADDDLWKLPRYAELLWIH